MVKSDSAVFTLEDYDGDENKKPLRVRVTKAAQWLAFEIEEHGDFHGEDIPIILEYHDNKVKIRIWGDINQEEPTHVISLEGARKYVCLTCGDNWEADGPGTGVVDQYGDRFCENCHLSSLED